MREGPLPKKPGGFWGPPNWLSYVSTPGGMAAVAEIRGREFYGEDKTPEEALRDLLGSAGKTLEEGAE